MNSCIQTGNIVYDLGFEKGYQVIAEAGFSSVDWSLDHAYSVPKLKKGEMKREDCIFQKSMQEILEYYRPELEEMEKNGLSVYQAHAPFPAIIEGQDDFLDYAISVYQKMIEFLDKVAPGAKLVIHGINCTKNSPYSPEMVEAMNRHLYESLIPTLVSCDVVVCMEDLFVSEGGKYMMEGHGSNPYFSAQFIDSLNEKAGKDCFGFCLDTGHLNLLKKDMRTFLPVLGKRIRCFHIHDNWGDDKDRHLAPFTGNIDWNLFCELVKKIGYDGDLSFETFNQTSKAFAFSETMCIAYTRLIGVIADQFRARILGLV